MIWATLIAAVIGALAAVIGIVINETRHAASRRWTAKFDRAAGLAVKIDRSRLSFSPGGGDVYEAVFPDADLRGRIELHLISVSSRGLTAQVRPVTREQLSTPAVRKTITDVLDAAEKFKREDPESANKLGI